MFRNDDPSHYYCFVEGLTKALRTLWYSSLKQQVNLQRNFI